MEGVWDDPPDMTHPWRWGGRGPRMPPKRQMWKDGSRREGGAARRQVEFTRLCGPKLSRNDQGLRQDCSAAERLETGLG